MLRCSGLSSVAAARRSPALACNALRSRSLLQRRGWSTATATSSEGEWKADVTRTLSNIVKEHPHLSSIFQRQKLDFCCNGHVPLVDACREKNLDLAEMVRELEQSVRDHKVTEDEHFLRLEIQRADQMDTTALCHNILDRHHSYLKMELPLLQHLMVKVARVHGDRHPELPMVRDIFLEEYESLAQHIIDEEKLIFEPFMAAPIESLPTDTLREIVKQISELEKDHTTTAEAFARIRELSDDLNPPFDACNSYRALYARLQNLEVDVNLHVQKENFILFPRITAHLAEREANKA